MIDLRDLISGVLVIIFLSMSIGQFEKLHSFAKGQAVTSLKRWPAYHFFPKGYGEEFSVHHVHVKNLKLTAY